MQINKIIPVFIGISFLMTACGNDQADQTEQAKKEILQAEKDFEAMAAQKGISEAFYFYADSNVVIKRRNDSLIHGREGLRNYFSNDYFKTATVKWTADFVDASSKGDIGYTYGHYTWESKDDSGKVSVDKGVFHTVWKKQKDGSWRYVWD
jgi:ketosteroid isomerase-like protein